MSDDVVITIEEAATVDAGPAQTICADSDVTLAGTFGGSATSATWSTSGDGTFNNATLLNAVYTPGTGDIAAGTVTLTLTTDDPAGVCPAVSDDVIITIEPVATVDAGTPQTICEGSTVTLAGTIGGSATSATWTTAGDGTFNDATLLNAVYTPGAGDIAAGTVTLTLTTNDPAGECPAVSDDVVITIEEAATVDAGTPQSICAGNPVTLTGTIGGSATSATWSTSGDGTFDDASLLNAEYTPGTGDIAAGTVKLTLTTNDPAGVCPAVIADVVITITDAPTATLSGDNTICQGESTDLTITLTGVGPWDIVYSDGVTNFNIDDILTSPHVFTVTPGTTTTYNLVSVSDSCSPTGTVDGTATITVQPIAPPTEAAISGDAIICSGESTNLVVTVTGGAAPFEVTLSDGVNPILISDYTSGDPIPVNPVTTTSYTITSVVDANGCNALSLTGTATVTVNPTPESAVLSGTTSICTGGTAVLTVTITDGTGPFSFTIDNILDPITNYTSGDPIPVDPAVTTTYTIVGNVTDANGCSVAGTGSATVTVSDSPTANLTGTTTICDGNSTNLTITLTGVAPWNVVYTDGTTNFTETGVTTSPLVISISPTTTTTYNLVSVDDACGSGATSGSATITVRDATDPVCTGGGTGCNAFTAFEIAAFGRPTCDGFDDGFLTIRVTGGTPGYTLTLSLADGSSPQSVFTTQSEYTFQNLSANLYRYRVVDALGNLCELEYALPQLTGIVATIDPASVTDASCFGTPTGRATITSITGGNAPYAYSVNGTDWTIIPSVPYEITDLPPNGTYFVLVGDDPSDTCPAQVEVTVNNANPQISIGLDVQDATCGNNDGAILITTPPSGGTGGPYTFRIDDEVVQPVNDAFRNLYGGNYTLTVIDNSGCERNFDVFVPYPDYIEIGGFSITDASCNEGASIAIFINNYIPAAQYEVAITNNIATQPVDYATQYYVGDGLIIIPDLSRGNYFFWIRTTGSQCPTLLNNFMDNLPIVLGGSIPVAFDLGCRYDTDQPDLHQLQLRNISGAPGLPFQYEVFGNGFLIQGTANVNPDGTALIDALAGPYVVRLIQDQNSIGGCPDQSTPFINAPIAALDTIFVRVPPPADKLGVSFPEKGTASRVVRIRESGLGDYEIRLELIQPFGAEDPSPVRDWSTVTNQEARFNNLYAGLYTLSLRDGYGCQKDYAVTIGMFTGIWIPNIFTPNNDGFNDTFYIRNLPEAGGARLIVSNRWGKQVFSSNNYQNEWDGANEADGVYYYRLQVGNEVFTGWVEILRGSKP